MCVWHGSISSGNGDGDNDGVVIIVVWWLWSSVVSQCRLELFHCALHVWHSYVYTSQKQNVLHLDGRELGMKY